ncbi:MAG: hypothetical protein WC789_10515 [Lentisphaeria bacterium]
MGGPGSGRPVGYHPRGGKRFRPKRKDPYGFERQAKRLERVQTAGRKGANAAQAEHFWRAYFDVHPCEHEGQSTTTTQRRCRYFLRDGLGYCRCRKSMLAPDLERYESSRDRGPLLREGEYGAMWIREDCAQTGDACFCYRDLDESRVQMAADRRAGYFRRLKRAARKAAATAQAAASPAS